MFTYLLMLLPLFTPGSTFVCPPVKKTCPNLNTVNDIYSKYARLQPVFRVVVTKGRDTGADSVCFTYTEVDPYTLVVYKTTTYANGDYETTTYVGAQSYPGVFRYSSMNGPLTDFSIGYAGCNTDIHYDCYDCAGTPDLSQGVSWTYANFTTSCFLRTQEILSSQNLPSDNLKVLPMKMPPNCFYPTNCLNINPLDCYGTQTPSRYPYLAVGSVSSFNY